MTHKKVFLPLVKMELGTKYKFKEDSIGTLIEKNKNYGLFKFEDGSQFVFNLNKLR